MRDLRSLVLRIAHRHLGYGLVTVGDVPDRERPDPAETSGSWRAHGLDDSVRRGLAQGATLDDITAGAWDAAMRLAVARADGDMELAARSLQVPLDRLRGWAEGRSIENGAVWPSG